MRSRGESAPLPKVNLAELTPKLMPYLGQAAYLQLSFFEAASRLTAEAVEVQDKLALALTAGQMLDKHQQLVAEIHRHGGVPSEVMEPFAARIDGYSAMVRGANWHESLTSIYLTAGLLDDFFTFLAAGLANGNGPKMVQIHALGSQRKEIAQILSRAISADQRLGSQLAMWGRRVVGDTLLMARSAIHQSGNAVSDELKIEPVFTEVIAAHTRRMDGLGLTA